MTVVHTYFYIVVYTQRECRTLKKMVVDIGVRLVLAFVSVDSRNVRKMF